VRKNLSLLAAVLAVAAVAAAGLLVLGGDDAGDESVPAAVRDGEELSAPGDAFRMRYPKGWERVANDALGVDGDAALAAIRRTDGSAQLVVQRAGRLSESRAQVAAGLTRRLRKQVADFELVNAEDVRLPSGEALSYTFLRKKTGQVQNLTVVDKGDASYTLSSVVAGDAQGAAREVAAIVRSFDPED
jgi:hypothetical protein